MYIMTENPTIQILHTSLIYSFILFSCYGTVHKQRLIAIAWHKIWFLLRSCIPTLSIPTKLFPRYFVDSSVSRISVQDSTINFFSHIPFWSFLSAMYLRRTSKDLNFLSFLLPPSFSIETKSWQKHQSLSN